MGTMLKEEETRSILGIGRRLEIEILVRLSFKDLGRCKAVCKGWRNLLSSSDFVSEHLLRSQLGPSSRRLILFEDPESHTRRDLARPPGSFTRVVCFSSLGSFLVGSVNGLICFVGNFRVGVTSPDDIWILNPVTSLSIKLPLPASPIVEKRDAVSFAFFWDSDSEGCYKVFKIVCEYQQYDIDPHHPDPLKPCNCLSEVISMARPIVSNRFEVWDSRYPDTWTEIKVDFSTTFYHPLKRITNRNIVVGRCSYWIVVDANGLDLLLLSIDMKTQVVKLISLPKLSIPSDVLIRKLIGPLPNPFLFCAIWEERFALIEKHDLQTMLYNVWAMNDSGTSWIKKTTFLVGFGFRRFIGCIDGKLLLQRDDRLRALFDMKTQKCDVLVKPRREVLGKANDTQEEEDCEMSQQKSWKYANSKISLEQFKTLFKNNGKIKKDKKEVVEDEFASNFVYSIHEFVGTTVSIEGFKPIGSFADCPLFTISWPNLPAFASKVSQSTSLVASGEKGSSVVVPPTIANVPSGVKPATSVNVSPAAAKGSIPVGAPASKEAPKKTYASLVAKWTCANSPRAAQLTPPKAPSVPLGDNGPWCSTGWE